MIQFACTHCQSKMSVADDKAGRSGKCPKCGGAIQVPPLMPPPPAPDTVAEDIPLAEELPRDSAAAPAWRQQPLRTAGGRVVRPSSAEDGIEEPEIALAGDSGEGEKNAPPEQESPPTAGGLVFTPAGEAMVVSFQAAKILDSLVIDTIGQELYALVDDRGCAKIVLDFGHVKFLSSQMLGVLMTLQKKVVGRSGRLALCGVQSDLRKLFQLVKLDRVLAIVDDRAAAVKALSRP